MIKKNLGIALLFCFQVGVLLGMQRSDHEAPVTKRPKVDVEMSQADLALQVEVEKLVEPMKVEKIFPQMDDKDFFDLLQQDFDFWFYGMENRNSLQISPNPKDREAVFKRFLTLSDDMFLYCCTDSGRQHFPSYGAAGQHYVFNSYFHRDDFRERVCKLGNEDFKELMDCEGPYGGTVFINTIGCFGNNSKAVISQFWERIKQLPEDMILDILNQKHIYISGNPINFKSYFEFIQNRLPQNVRDEINKFYAESIS